MNTPNTPVVRSVAVVRFVATVKSTVGSGCVVSRHSEIYCQYDGSIVLEARCRFLILPLPVFCAGFCGAPRCISSLPTDAPPPPSP